MTPIEETLVALDLFCSENSIDYIVIGGTAVIHYGYLRTTKDIDLTVLCKLEDMKSIHGKISKHYNLLPEDSLEFFSKNFVLPSIDNRTNIRIDFSAGLTEFDKKAIKRKQKKFFGDAEVFFCSLEDLIIYKLFAGRAHDLVDVEYLFKRNTISIDKNYLIKTAEQFRELDREDIIVNLHKFL